MQFVKDWRPLGNGQEMGGGRLCATVFESRQEGSDVPFSCHSRGIRVGGIVGKKLRLSQEL